MFLLLYFLLVTTHQSFTYTYTVNDFSIVMLNVKLKQNKRYKTYMSNKKRQQDKKKLKMMSIFDQIGSTCIKCL